MPSILRKDAARWRREIRETFVLATPLILGQLSSIGMNVIDTLLAGHLDARTLAAVAVGTSLWSLAIVAAIGVMLALPPSVAQLSGAGEHARIGPLFRQALWLAFALGFALFFMVRASGALLGPIGIEPAIANETQKFLHAIAWGAPALTGYFALRGFSEGLGIPRPTMYFGLLGLALLAPIGYVLMYGKLGLPARGAQGSGMATATVLWVQFGAFALYLQRRRHYREVAPFGRFEPPHWRTILGLLRLGVPMGIAVLMEAGLFVATALLIGSLGATAVAGHQVAINVASVAFMVPLGVAMATTVRVGNAVGRGDVEAVRYAGYAGIAVTALTQSLSSLVMALFPLAIARVYTDDAAVAAMAARLMLLAAIFQFSDGVQVTANGALRGLKDAALPMAITVFAYWGVGMPTGYWLAFHAGLGARGMWIGLIAGLTVAAALLFTRFALRTTPR
ncbi:MAG TPA: MATE family efflux transporter [Rudaea sp.]|nr:MATE family efflux transporter [Rudaea sp.]